MITEIKKGDKFVCVNGRPIVQTITGKVYESHADGEIYSENNFRVIVDLSDSACAETFNSEFIPCEYNAVREYYFNHIPMADPQQTEVLRKIWNLLGEIHPLQSRNWSDKHVHRLENSVTKGWTEAWMKDAEIAHKNKLASGDCQGNCASCQCDPDVQHELEKEGIEYKEEQSAIEPPFGLLHETVRLPPYYNNDNGSLYKIAEQRGWNVRIFDLVKRLERNGKKDPLEQEIRKSIGVLELWLKELKQD